TDAAELEAQVRDNAAGYLGDVWSVIVLGRLADGQILFSRAGGKVLGDMAERLFIDSCMVSQGARIHGDVEDRRVRGAVGKRRDRSVDVGHAGLDRFETTQSTEAGRAVRVQFNDLAVGGSQQSRHNCFGSLGRQNSARVLENNPV